MFIPKIMSALLRRHYLISLIASNLFAMTEFDRVSSLFGKKLITLLANGLYEWKYFSSLKNKNFLLTLNI